MTVERALEIWKQHAILREGKRNVVYYDSEGKPTVGIGHLVVQKDHLRIGDSISEEEIDGFFKQDSDQALKTSLNQWEEIGILTAEFLAALISVNFQLGNFAKKFPNSYKFLVQHKFDQAIANIKSSLWARQTPVRANDFIEAIENR